MRKSAERRVDASFAKLLGIQPRHLRSVQLDRDFDDRTSSLHYVVTPFVRSTMRRLAEGLREGSTARAWRLTGDYGTGKSSLALALSRVAAGDLAALPEGLSDLSSEVRLEPVLVVGEREPIGRSVLRGLRSVADARKLAPKGSALLRLLRDAEAPQPSDVIDAIDAMSSALSSGGHADGLLLILDELGKNLEHVVRSSASEDVYLLQRLAEAAARSGRQPLMVVAVLHQAVATYAASLSSTDRREWEKVAGRFEEIVFAPPLEQSATLVAAALGIDREALPPGLSRAAGATIDRKSVV